MKILILGGDGMLGHRLLLELSGDHDAKATLRQSEDCYAQFGMFRSDNAYFGVDVRLDSPLLEVLADFRPDVVINAVGLVKQRDSGQSSIPSIEINALFPHRLAVMTKLNGIRLIHFSTDCVFSGMHGGYRESDRPDPADVYGRSKLLGEVDGEGCITLRTSIIGLELGRSQGLVEWLLRQSDTTIAGYTQAIYSGITTHEAVKVVETVMRHASLNGIWHVASKPISKFDLLSELLAQLGRRDVQIKPYDGFSCNRSLSGDAFTSATGYVAPEWRDMLGKLAGQIRAREQ